MVSVADREMRRHTLKLIADTPDGEENSRIIYQSLLTLGHRLTWGDFDQLITYAERAGWIEIRWLRPEIDRTRILRITKLGLDLVGGVAQDPAILPPAQRREP